jgi:predicted ATPase
MISKTDLRDSRGRYIAYFSRDLRKPLPGFENMSFSLQGFLPFLSSGESRVIEAHEGIRELVSEEFSKHLYYISSKRGLTSRSEGVDQRFSRRPDNVGVNGEDIVPVLAYIKDDASYAEVVEKINHWLEKFGLTKAAANIVDGPAYSLKLTNKKTLVQSSVLDIGFGVNQLLPVIVQCFYAPAGSLIMIEQPEAHLHPKAQANITDFLIDVVKSGKRVLVETHSEHLLLRLQRRVAEGSLDPSRVNICYFDQTSEETKKTDIRIDNKGYFIEPIPEGFFEEGFQEALGHLKAAGSSSD